MDEDARDEGSAEPGCPVRLEAARADFRRKQADGHPSAGLMGSGLDLSGFGTEEDIATAIQERLKG
jgi:hypothetical protein